MLWMKIIAISALGGGVVAGLCWFSWDLAENILFKMRGNKSATAGAKTEEPKD